MPPSIDVAPVLLPVTPSRLLEQSTPHGGDDGHTTSKPQQTRKNRTQLNCNHCRHSKLKCDRKNPCSHCIKKGMACTFTAPAPRRRPPASLQNRLLHLESLVKDVINSQPQKLQDMNPSDISHSLSNGGVSLGFSAGISETLEDSAGSPSKDAAVCPAQVLLGANETTYVGATHWAAILDDIEEVKSYLNETEAEEYDSNEDVRPDTSLIFNAKAATTKLDLLAALPHQAIVDQLVSRYFYSNSPAIFIIHKHVFQKEYKRFWSDPAGTPVRWLGMLYALMCLATFHIYITGDENPDTRGTTMEMIRTYRGCCAQCLVLSNYAAPGPYTLETLIMYIEGEFVLSKNNQVNSYFLIGLAVRLALRMGLHRDSTKVRGSIKPFQTEMRRRVWHILCQLDLLVSSQLGLPGMITAIESDTIPPGNLNDEDFDDDSIELPAPRPDTEMTLMSYSICKGRICHVYGNILVLANGLSVAPYSEVMRLDSLLHQAHDRLPPFLRNRPVALSVIDSPELIIQRISIALMFHKGRCVLHRQYLMKERDNPVYSYSRDAVLDAALEILQCQSEVHDAVQPRGRLCRDRWFISSLSMHDFLLAAMIVYLSVIHVIDGNSSVNTTLETINQQQRDMLLALERSHAIWTKTETSFADSKKASMILGIMMKKINSAAGRRNGPFGEPGFTERHTSDYCENDLVLDLSLNDSIPSSGMPTNPADSDYFNNQEVPDTESVPYSGSDMQIGPDSIPTPMEPLGAMIDMPSNFDWEIFDTHILPQQAVDDTWADVSFESFGFGNYDEYYNS